MGSKAALDHDYDSDFDHFYKEAAKVIRKQHQQMANIDKAPETVEKQKQKLKLTNAELRQLMQAFINCKLHPSVLDFEAKLLAEGEESFPLSAHFSQLKRQVEYSFASFASSDITSVLEAVKMLMAIFATEDKKSQQQTDTLPLESHTDHSLILFWSYYRADQLLRLAARQYRLLLTTYHSTTTNGDEDSLCFLQTSEESSSVLLTALTDFLITLIRSPSRVIRQISTDSLLELLKSILPLVVIFDVEQAKHEKNSNIQISNPLNELLKVLASRRVSAIPEKEEGRLQTYYVDHTTYLSALLRIFVFYQAKVFCLQEDNTFSGSSSSTASHVYVLKVADLLSEALSELKMVISSDDSGHHLQETLNLDLLLYELFKFYEFYGSKCE